MGYGDEWAENWRTAGGPPIWNRFATPDADRK